MTGGKVKKGKGLLERLNRLKDQKSGWERGISGVQEEFDEL